MLMVLLFHRPVLEIISYCCFILSFFLFCFDFFFAVVQTRHFSDVEVASCVLQRLLRTQLSAVEDVESFEGLRRRRELWVVLQGQWFPTWEFSWWRSSMDSCPDWNNKLLLLLCVDMTPRGWNLLNVVITTFHSATIKENLVIIGGISMIFCTDILV